MKRRMQVLNTGRVRAGKETAGLRRVTVVRVVEMLQEPPESQTQKP